MKHLMTIINRAFFFAILIGGSCLAMEGDQKPENASWQAMKAYLTQELSIQSGQPCEKRESMQRLRKSAIKLGMRDWQDSPAQAAPRPTIQVGCQIKLEDTITDIALVPYTQKILMSAYNTLHRYDMETKTIRALAFARPIAKLIQSVDGSLCAVLLEPLEDEEPLVRFVNACKSDFELNTDIEPIPYCQTADCELNPVDLSADARFIGVISTPASATIHNLKTNEPHAIIFKNEEEFPVFSIHFFKAKKCVQDLDAQNICAVQTNMQITLYAITDEGCVALQKIDLKAHAVGHDYFSRQSAWLFPELLVVLLGNQLLAFVPNKNGSYEFKQRINAVGEENELIQCNTNSHVLIERDCKKKKIIKHDLATMTRHILSNPSNDRVLMDESASLAVIARKNELMLITKEKSQKELKKGSFDVKNNDETTE